MTTLSASTTYLAALAATILAAGRTRHAADLHTPTTRALLLGALRPSSTPEAARAVRALEALDAAAGDGVPSLYAGASRAA